MLKKKRQFEQIFLTGRGGGQQILWTENNLIWCLEFQINEVLIYEEFENITYLMILYKLIKVI